MSSTTLLMSCSSLARARACCGSPDRPRRKKMGPATLCCSSCEENPRNSAGSMNTGISFAADRSLSAFSPTHRTELWTSRCCVNPGAVRPTRAARHPACGQTDAEFSELRFGRHFFAAEIRCALPNSADGLVNCEGQHQLRQVMLREAGLSWMPISPALGARSALSVSVPSSLSQQVRKSPKFTSP